MVDCVKTEYENVPISIFATSFGAYLFLNYLKNSTTDFKHILHSPAIFMDEVLLNSILLDHNILPKQLLSQEVDLGYNRVIAVDHDFLQSLKDNKLTSHVFTKHINIIQGDTDDYVDILKNKQFYQSNLLDYNVHTKKIFTN